MMNPHVCIMAALAIYGGVLSISPGLHPALVAARDGSGREAATGTCSGTGANPWTYNFEVNGYPAKVLNDAALVQPLETSLLVPPNQDLAVISRAMKRRFLNHTHAIGDNSVLYIDWDGEGMLFDAGAGPGEAPVLGFGMTFEHLEAEGIARDSIKHVLVTHGHFDHLAGVVEDLESLKPAYPHATIYISRAEYEFWMEEPVNRSTSLFPDELWETGIILARSVLQAVKPQLKLFELDEEVLPGIMPIHTPWHTPGHAAYAIDDGDSKLVYTGDSVVHKVLAIENPWFGLLSDTTPEATTPGRYAMLDEVVREGWQVLCGHVTFPGLLHVENEGANFRTTTRGYEGSGEAMSVCE